MMMIRSVSSETPAGRASRVLIGAVLAGFALTASVGLEFKKNMFTVIVK